MLRTFFKRGVQTIFPYYRLAHIYGVAPNQPCRIIPSIDDARAALEVDPPDMGSKTPAGRPNIGLTIAQVNFRLLVNGIEVSSCSIIRDTIADSENLWPVSGPERVEITKLRTVEQFRGKGYAALLVSGAQTSMASIGIRAMYASIWHSNIASVRVFKACGWRRVATVAKVKLIGTRAPLRIVIPGARRSRESGA